MSASRSGSWTCGAVEVKLDLVDRPDFEPPTSGSADPVVFLRVGRVDMGTEAADEGWRRVAGSGDGFADEGVVGIIISCT